MARTAASRAMALLAAVLLGLSGVGLSFSLGTSASRLPARACPNLKPGSEQLVMDWGGCGRAGNASGSARAATTLAAAAGLLCCALAVPARRRRAGPPGGVHAALPACRPRAVARAALPEHAELLQGVLKAAGPDLEQLSSLLRQWAEDFAQGAPAVPPLVPAAWAADVVAAAPKEVSEAVTAAASAVQVLPEGVTLEEGVAYIKDASGFVLLDPMNNQPLKDDWWNSFIGLQADAIRGIDGQLRQAGVNQAFGWSILLYTLAIKLVFFPLQQGQLKSTAMMQMLAPKVKEIQTKYADDPDRQTRLLTQLYANMDVNPLGGCLPVLLTLPLYWALFSVWRRLSVEKFPYFTEGFLWIPSLAYPNPDFQFKFDWLLEFKDGAPAMGWADYGAYLVLPALLVGTSVVQQQDAQSKSATKGGSEEQQLVMQLLPALSIYLIGSLALELPQAVSLYYAANTGLTVAQTQFVKMGLRSEIPGYEEFERTGKFPEGAIEESLAATQVPSKSLHEAAMRADLRGIKGFLEVGEDGKPAADIDSWDEKEIAPIGYGAACGHADVVKLLIERGADMKKLDGQGNSLLHYAAGYGHLEVLKLLLSAGDEVWPDNEWKDIKNKKGQSIMDAARVNKKAPVLAYLNQQLGIAPEVEVLEAAPVAAAPAPAQTPAAAAGAGSSTDQARSALLAAAGAVAQPPASAAGAAPPLGSEATASRMREAIEKLKSDPKAIEQAREMMDKIPPGMLSMLSGGKMSGEDAQKAMDAMKKMKTEDILAGAEKVVDRLPVAAQPGAAAPAPEAVKAAAVVDAAVMDAAAAPPAPAAGGKTPVAQSARAID